ncbi:hypothetical protein EHS25_009826 [Saitozyma podzolica]|uniref:Uncharacterized protein n=1 Tax=Saitozyma podzolica TaxID=1890683 RepID=A0A427YKD6_9TREE|nr:hypothetical protein EHS25_009826 [Saitozyma podzolica]
MSSDTVNELKQNFLKIEQTVEESVQTPRLILATRTDGTGSVEVLEEIDGKIQDPLGPEHTASYKRFVWPKRTEFLDVTGECVEKSVWSHILQYQVSRARESEEAGQRIMQGWRDAADLIPATDGMDQAEISAQVETLRMGHQEAYTAQRNAQEALESVGKLGFELYESFDRHLTSLQALRPSTLGRTRSTSERVANRLSGNSRDVNDPNSPIPAEVDSLIHDSQLRVVHLEDEIRDNKLNSSLTMEERSTQSVTESESFGEDGSSQMWSPNAAIGFDVISTIPFRLEAFPRLQWPTEWSITISPYLSHDFEPPTTQGAQRLDGEPYNQLTIEFHLKEDEEVLPVRLELQRSLEALNTLGVEWAKISKDREQLTMPRITAIGSSAETTSPQAVHKLLEWTRQQEDRQVFVERLPAALNGTFEQFAEVARNEVASCRSRLLDLASTEPSRQFAELWLDTLSNKVDQALFEGKSHISRRSADLCSALGSKAGKSKRTRTATKQKKTAREYGSRAGKLADQAGEAAKELGIILPSSLTELESAIHELDAKTESVVIPALFQAIPDNWHSAQQETGRSSGHLAPSISVSDLGSELSATTLTSDNVSEASGYTSLLSHPSPTFQPNTKRRAFHTDSFYTERNIQRYKESGHTQEARFEQLKANPFFSFDA